METIHLKTVDPISQDLLRRAAKKGIALNWDRYEKLQPQDGFLRLGLSCPFGCLQGPCRIDPFGRGPDRGLCGMDRDVMAAAMLLRICLAGTLTILNDIAPAEQTPTVHFSAALKKSVGKALPGVNVNSLSTAEIFKGAALLERPAASFELLLEQTLVLSLLGVGLLRKNGQADKVKDRNIRAGYGVLAGAGIHIAIAGRPSRNLMESLSRAAGKSKTPVRLVSLGEWIPASGAYLPILCSSAEAELALTSHAIHFLVAGAGADPGVIETARKLGMPASGPEDKEDAVNIVRSAQKFSSRAPRPEMVFESGLMGAGEVFPPDKKLMGSAGSKAKTRLALLGGSDSLHHPLGHLAVALSEDLQRTGIQVGGWGDAAVWMIKNGLASRKEKDSVYIMDPKQGPLQVLDEPVLAGKPDRLKGICFTGSRDCRDLPVALGLALLGYNVAMADPVPFWGSSHVRSRLSELLERAGGRFTAFDHPAQAQELLKWFTK